MQDLKKLEESSLEELLFEIRSREAEAKSGAAAKEANAAANEAPDPARDGALQEFNSAMIADIIQEKQKGIYGVDDRQDIVEVTDQAILNDADSVVALFRSNRITDNGNGTSTLRTR